jgi:hypothetical protein
MNSLLSWLEKKMGAKALQNTGKTLKNADILALKVDRALQTYPFHEISPDLHVKINPRAKRLALRVDPRTNKVNLVVPKRESMINAYRFAQDNRYWIREKLNGLPHPISLIDGAIIPIMGEDTKIKVIYDKTLKATDIALINNEIYVKTNKNDPKPRILRFLKNMALEEISALSYEKAEQISKKIAKIDVKDTSSRWGSCSHDGKLSFSWRLIFAPYEAFDYVIAHEVAHLEVMDHSPAFWEICENLSENYAIGKNWMKHHSGELIRYS